MKKVCRKSHKVKFKTHERALQRGGKSLDNSGATELYAYRCSWCGHYHLTHDENGITQQTVERMRRKSEHKTSKALRRHLRQGARLIILDGAHPDAWALYSKDYKDERR